MSQRKELDGRAVLIMLTLCMVWGMQQSLLKLTAPDMAPIMQIALRSGIAAVLVGLFMRWKKETISVTGITWRPGWLAGALFALEFLLVGEGLRHTSASHTAVFLYTAPIFAALGLHLWLPAERLNRLQWSGILLAFAGIAVTFLWRSATTQTAGEPLNMLWGDFLALLAGLAWGATTVVIRCSSLTSASASQTLLYQLLAAFVVLLLAALVSGQATVRLTPWVWGNLVFQSVVVSFVSFLVWFWLLRHYLASRLGAFSFITPLFGVAFGVWLLQESLEPSFMVGAVLVLAGVIMVNSRGWVKPK